LMEILLKCFKIQDLELISKSLIKENAKDYLIANAVQQVNHAVEEHLSVANDYLYLNYLFYFLFPLNMLSPKKKNTA